MMSPMATMLADIDINRLAKALPNAAADKIKENKMSKYITLHNCYTNTECLVNVDSIAIIDTVSVDAEPGKNRSNKRMCSEIIIIDKTIRFKVNETPDKICNMLAGYNKFIRLHNASANTSIIVNKEIILICCAAPGSNFDKTMIITARTQNNIADFIVNEKPARILELLESNKIENEK